ncbi:Chloroperoxidase [Suillus paluster]|uniref:Chloroperoxidase n=1 Tax=Suillus paluster TaxID=48578 RepID=UPI001B85D916|nr:Chloroperoxidase [Suillus paluster]KAG1729478.1 Chloroperoxidase [Suillus paluster]
MGFFSSVSNFICNVAIICWDVILTLLNLVRRKRRVGHVTPEGHPGYGGHWPEFRPPQETDSRSACPGLNAMANHGIISRTGRGLSFVEVTHQIPATYNFSPTMCSCSSRFAATMLKRNYNKDTFDLEELNQHNGIEHDASLLRFDTAFEPDQAKKDVPFIEELLAAATGKDKHGHDIITTKDFSRMLGKRRAIARATNKGFKLSLLHRFFGSTNASTLVAIFGGRVNDLRTFLLDERLPEGWESRARQAHGITMTGLSLGTVSKVEFGVREKDWAGAAREAAEGQGA